MVPFSILMENQVYLEHLIYYIDRCLFLVILLQSTSWSLLICDYYEHSLSFLQSPSLLLLLLPLNAPRYFTTCFDSSYPRCNEGISVWYYSEIKPLGSDCFMNVEPYRISVLKGIFREPAISLSGVWEYSVQPNRRLTKLNQSSTLHSDFQPLELQEILFCYL